MDASEHFQVTGCAGLPFGPTVRMRNLDAGRKSTLRSWNPRMRLVVTQKDGEAGIKGAQVTLPHSVILDQSNIRTICTRAQFAAQRCPRQAIYGHAKAWSPVLNRPVTGPVYLGSSPNPLPDLIVDLDGEVRVTLQGRIDTARGGWIRNTFTAVPDAPVSRFELTMFGGKNRGLLVNSTDLCRSNERGVARFDGHNGKQSGQRLRIGLRYRGCKQVRKRIARRQAAREVAKRKAARRVIERMSSSTHSPRSATRN